MLQRLATDPTDPTEMQTVTVTNRRGDPPPWPSLGATVALQVLGWHGMGRMLLFVQVHTCRWM